MSLPNFYSELQAGAPAGVVNGQGNLCAILDACLVNGFNSHTISGSAVEASGTVTVTDTAHGFRDGQLVLIAGATPAGFNGSFRIVRINANSFSYTPTSGTGTATGTITAKTPSLGWTIAFTASNQRVYQAAAGNQFFLDLDDTATTGGSNFCVHVRGYETMSGVGAGTNPFPPDANLSGTGPFQRWMRCQYVDNGTTQVGWVVIGDDKRFYLGTPGYSSLTYRTWFGFGDFTSYLNADAFNSFMAGDCSHGNGDSYYYYGQFPTSYNSFARSGANTFWTAELALTRGYDQATVGVSAACWSAFSPSVGTPMGSYNGNWAAVSSPTPFVSPITGANDLTPIDIVERSTSGAGSWRRGRLPGMLHVLGKPDASYANDKVVTTGVSVYGEVVFFSGCHADGASWAVFALCDWDTM